MTALSIQDLPYSNGAVEGLWLIQVRDNWNCHHAQVHWVEGRSETPVAGTVLRRLVAASNNVLGAMRVQGEPCELGDCSTLKPGPTAEEIEAEKALAELLLSEAALPGEVPSTDFSPEELDFLRGEGLVRRAPSGNAFVKEPTGEKLDKVLDFLETTRKAKAEAERIAANEAAERAEAERLAAVEAARIEAERIAAEADAAEIAARAKAEADRVASEATAKAKAEEEAKFEADLAAENAAALEKARNATTAVEERPAPSAEDTQKEIPSAKAGKTGKASK